MTTTNKIAIFGIVIWLFTLFVWIHTSNSSEKANKLQEKGQIRDEEMYKSEKSISLGFSGETTFDYTNNTFIAKACNYGNEDIFFENQPIVATLTGNYKNLNLLPGKIQQNNCIDISWSFNKGQALDISLWCRFINEQILWKCQNTAKRLNIHYEYPKLSYLNIVWIDASGLSDQIDFSLIKKTFIEQKISFLWTTSSGKEKWVGKINIQKQCTKRKSIFMFYNEKKYEYGSAELIFLRQRLFEFYSKVWAISSITDVKLFTFTDFRNPTVNSCESKILDIIGDCSKTRNGDEKNICSRSSVNFQSALDEYSKDGEQPYYTNNFITDETDFIFIIFAVNSQD